MPRIVTSAPRTTNIPLPPQVLSAMTTLPLPTMVSGLAPAGQSAQSTYVPAAISTVSPGRASAAASLGFWYFSPDPTFRVRPTKPSGSGRDNSAPELSTRLACAIEGRGGGVRGGRGVAKGRDGGGRRPPALGGAESDAWGTAGAGEPAPCSLSAGGGLGGGGREWGVAWGESGGCSGGGLGGVGGGTRMAPELRGIGPCGLRAAL